MYTHTCNYDGTHDCVSYSDSLHSGTMALTLKHTMYTALESVNNITYICTAQSHVARMLLLPSHTHILNLSSLIDDVLAHTMPY